MKKIEEKEIIIMQEMPEQYEQTEAMARRSFWNMHGPGCDEHLLVHIVRDADIYLPELSRVAVMDGKVVGTIMYSKATLTYNEVVKEILTFGPLCVDPSAQDQGVGGKLLEQTLVLAREAGYDAIVIFGEPGYYPKHGFQTCDHFNVTTMDGGNSEAFMGYELKPGILTKWSEEMGCKGKFAEGEVFETLTMEDADALGAKYEPLLKLRVPCQWNYENAYQDRVGYGVVDAVQFKGTFQEMFDLYAKELSAYKPWILTQISEDGNYLVDQVEQYFDDPNKKPYVLFSEGQPAGLLVLSGSCADPEKEDDVDSFDIEEFFVTEAYRGKGIAENLVQRIWSQIKPDPADKMNCELCVLDGNERAIHFWEKMIHRNGLKYTKRKDENDMWAYRIEMPSILIDCGRVVVREYNENDLDPIYNITTQPEIAEFLSDWVASREQREEWLLKYELPENQDFMRAMPKGEENILRCVIVLKETGKVIGWIVSGMKDGVPAPNREVGYAISNQFTGNGYATEAVKGLTQFLFRDTDTEELVAVALTYNEGSNHVIRKSGFKFQGIIDLEGENYNYYRLKKRNRRLEMRIETERLIIRNYTMEDEADLCEYMLQRVDAEFEQYEDFTREKGKEEIEFRSGSDEFYAIELKEEHKVIGNVYFGKRDFNSRELGYVLNENYQNKGYGSEASKAVVDNAFAQGLHRVFAECCPQNPASWKLMEKIGMEREAFFKQNVSFKQDKDGNPIYWDTYVYALLNPEKDK